MSHLSGEERYEFLRDRARAAPDENSRNHYNRQARDYIFGLNNANLPEGVIDLHRLYKDEAIEILLKRMNREIEMGRDGIEV